MELFTLDQSSICRWLNDLFLYVGGKTFLNFRIVSLCLSEHKQWEWKLAQAVIVNIAIFCTLFVSLIIMFALSADEQINVR